MAQMKIPVPFYFIKIKILIHKSLDIVVLYEKAMNHFTLFT